MSSVKLIDHMGDDQAIVDAARISVTGSTKKSETRALIRYLMRHKHTSPFEMVEFKFHVKVPIFVARQWLRHRMASVNEMSGRYSVLPSEYYVPEVYHQQSQTNHQGSDACMDVGEFTRLKQKASCDLAFHTYEEMIAKGVSREEARIHLPLGTMTEFIWKIDLHNLLHFLHLRMDSHAQPEIQEPARQIWDLIQPIVPLTCEAFKDFVIDAVTLSGPEIRGEVTGQGELREYKEKLSKLQFERRIL
jgi:thymidylate synthase (FAD)